MTGGAEEDLWQQVLDWGNLLLAYRKARRGKGEQAEIRRFAFDLEYELADLRENLLQGRYQPGPYRQFQIRDRKPRLISASPFRDRVAQHALMNVMEPRLDRLFISDTYASRTGKGVHRAVRRYQAWANRFHYALKLDIRRYFDSLDHRLLKEKLRAVISDAQVLWLFGAIIDSSPVPRNPCAVAAPGEDLVGHMLRPAGLPLGNLTSQFLGNLYLNDLDHYLKDTLKIPAYLRYVDDLVLLSDSKPQLWAWCERIEGFLAHERLGIHPDKKLLVPVAEGLDVLGYRVFPTAVRLSRGSGYRFRRKLKGLAAAYREGTLDLEGVRPHVAGWLGHASQADAQGLCRKLLASVSFRRGDSAERAPGGSGRFVEQQPTEPSVG